MTEHEESTLAIERLEKLVDRINNASRDAKHGKTKRIYLTANQMFQQGLNKARTTK